MRDAFIATGEVGQDVPPGRVGQRGEGAIQRSGRMLNHLVKYIHSENGIMQIKFLGSAARVWRKRGFAVGAVVKIE
jgi:hypothetical protein